MTDPDGPPSELDDVVVTGQRARGPSPFAELQYPSKGNSAGGDQQQEVGEGSSTGTSPSDEEVQCDDAEGRRQWNADAKAREAIARFRAAALARYGEDLQNREFGALICEYADGTIDISPISDGPPILDGNGNAIHYDGGRPTVAIPATACVNGTPIGMVHSHPGVNTGIPSLSDFAFVQHLVNYLGANADSIGVYTVASHQGPNGQYEDRVSRAGLADRDTSQSEEYEPEWVDPNATPCPGS